MERARLYGFTWRSLSLLPYPPPLLLFSLFFVVHGVSV